MMVAFLAGAGLVAPIQAESAAQQVVRFTVFSARPVADVVFTPRPDAEPRKLAFYPTARSPRYEYHGAMPLQFLDAGTGETVAEATIPSGISDALLLFLPMEKSPGEGRLRYRVAVLDDSPAQLQAGELAVINLSGLALGGTINGASVTVNAGLNSRVAVDRSARVVLQTTLKGRSYQSYANTITLGPTQRALLVLFPPFYRGSLEVQSRVLLDSVKR